jgi:hypothetical protein
MRKKVQKVPKSVNISQESEQNRQNESITLSLLPEQYLPPYIQQGSNIPKLNLNLSLSDEIHISSSTSRVES